MSPGTSPARLVRLSIPSTSFYELLSDPETMAAAAEGVLSDQEQAMLVWSGRPVRRKLRGR